MNEVYEMNEILSIFGSFIGGIIIGFIIYHFTIAKNKVTAQQQEMDKTKSELEEYKSKVNSHFTNTAELMGDVANSYQALYSHMANQSQDLLGDTELSPFPLLETTAVEEEEYQVNTEEQEIASVENEETAKDNEDPEPQETEVDNSEDSITETAEIKEETDLNEPEESNKDIADESAPVTETTQEETNTSEEEETKKTV